MNNFPFYKHWVIKIAFNEQIAIDKLLVENLGKQLISELKLNVVRESDYEFGNHGFTKIYILSQSHLIFPPGRNIMPATLI